MAKTSSFPIAVSANDNDLFCIEDAGGTKKIRKDNLFTGSSNTIGTLWGAGAQLSLDGLNETPVNITGLANASGIANATNGNLVLPIGKIKLDVNVKFSNAASPLSLHLGVFDQTTFTEIYVTRLPSSAEQDEYKRFIIVLDVLISTTYNIRCFKNNESSTVDTVDVLDTLIIVEKLA